MFDEDEYIDYDRLVDDSDDLLDDDYYDDFEEYEDDHSFEWDNYYHNLVDDIIDE